MATMRRLLSDESLSVSFGTGMRRREAVGDERETCHCDLKTRLGVMRRPALKTCVDLCKRSVRPLLAFDNDGEQDLGPGCHLERSS
jgi:hypothetical protein